MWQKIKEFSCKDPLIFTIIIALVVVGAGFIGVQTMHATSTAEFCQTCHAKEEIAVRGEYYTWRKSIHSEVDVSCLDCHGDPGIIGYLDAHIVAGTRSLYHEIFTSEEQIIEDLTHYGSTVEGAEKAAFEDSCLYCHSDEANKEMRRNRIIKIAGEFRHMDEVVMPEYREEYGRADVFADGVQAGVEPNHTLHKDMGLSCFNCHLGIGHSGERFHEPEMATCFECHDDVRAQASPHANDDCATCHVAQKEIQEGTYAEGIEGYSWYMADLDCSDCHESAFIRPNTDTCVMCHDESYADIMTDTQNYFNEQLVKVQKQRDFYMAKREAMPHGQRELTNELLYIVRVIESDGSEGVHNPEYFDMMFEKANDLTAKIKNYVEPEETEETHAPVITAQSVSEEETHAEKTGPVNSEEMMSILEGLETIDLKERYAPEGKKKAVIFEHKGHAERLACASCHEYPEAGMLKFEVPEVVEGTKNVFHTELCIKCHKEMRATTSCGACHK
ncbi:MAG: cytochrome C [Denitrovibrio sp.]|nr:MAG: cytochrome C [Denitrovibrio sp.]